MVKHSIVPGVLLPLNGQLCTMEDFMRRIEASIVAAQNYERGVARPVNTKTARDIRKALSDHFKQE